MSSPDRTLADALNGLLFDRAYREHFLRGEHDALGLSDADLRQLDTVDRSELVKTSRRIIADIVGGNFAGQGGLRASFPGVWDAIRDTGISLDELMPDFVSSPEFERYRELPFAGPGTCIEEAFFLFLSRHEQFCCGAPTNMLLLTHEFLTVMLSVLTVNPEPHFVVASKDLIRHNGHAWYAVSRYPAEVVSALLGRRVAGDDGTVLMLYAATGSGRFVSGPIDEFSLYLIELGAAEDAGDAAPIADLLVAADLIESAP